MIEARELARAREGRSADLWRNVCSVDTCGSHRRVRLRARRSRGVDAFPGTTKPPTTFGWSAAEVRGQEAAAVVLLLDDEDVELDEELESEELESEELDDEPESEELDEDELDEEDEDRLSVR